MKKSIRPGFFKGQVRIPASKSYMQRAIAIATLVDGQTIIENPAASNDCDAALKVAEALGAEIKYKQTKISISSNRYKREDEINVGESGLGLRMFTPICALNPTPIKVNGEGSLLKRPITPLIEALQAFGIQLKNHELPIEVFGGYKTNQIELDGSMSSQILTGLLIALPSLSFDTILKVNKLKSIPYVNMTIDILDKFGVIIDHENHKTYRIAGKQKYKSINYFVEGDWSSAAFIIVAGAINGNVVLSGLNRDSVQADKFILDVMQKTGVKCYWNGKDLCVEKSEIKAFDFDATHCPDLFPALTVLAIYSQGVCKIKGVHRLIHKESDRARSIVSEFRKMGADISIQEDYLVVSPSKLKGADLDSHNDHRIAMAIAVAALGCEGVVSIDNWTSVNKSWQGFFDMYEEHVEL